MSKSFLHSKFKIEREDLPICALLVHLILLSLAYLLLYYIGERVQLPNYNNLLNWDAAWYYKIKKIGYYYIEGQQCPLAFFPLFPFVWKFSTLDQQGISLFNLLIFSISFYFVCKHLAFDFYQSLLFISTPCLIFCGIPYSESFFFCSSVIMLIGFDENKNHFILFGILMASLTRSVNITFIPAIMFTYLIVFKLKRGVARPIISQIIVIALGVFATFYIQYHHTGEWFKFFEVQKTWNRSLQIPTFPLTTLVGTEMLWIDGIALAICLLAFFDVIKVMLNFLIYKKESFWVPSALFSMAYLSVVGLLSVFFSGVWENQIGTSIMSIDRYVLSTPFFIFYIYHKAQRPKNYFGFKETLFAIVVITISLGGYAPLEGIPNYGITLLYLTGMAVYIAFYVHLQHLKKMQVLFYGINLIVQVIFISRFLSYQWVG